MALKLSTGLVNGILDTNCFKTLMGHGILYLYSGLQPATADAIETAGSVALLKVTLASGAFTSGVSTNGINWDDAVLNVISKAAAETWSGVGIADGTAGWFRFYANTVVLGASTSAVRFDGRISSVGGGGEIELSSTTIATGATTTITAASFTIPLSA